MYIMGFVNMMDSLSGYISWIFVDIGVSLILGKYYSLCIIGRLYTTPTSILPVFGPLLMELHLHNCGTFDS